MLGSQGKKLHHQHNVNTEFWNFYRQNRKGLIMTPNPNKCYQPSQDKHKDKREKRLGGRKGHK